MQSNRQKMPDSPKESSPQMNQEMDPVALLTFQHREVDALFEQIESANEKSYRTKEKIAQTIAQKLLFHARLEEKIFYPMAQEFLPDMVPESLEEHELMKIELKRLLSAKANDFSFRAKITVLKELIHHHVEEEENEMFPQIRKQCEEEDFRKIGAKIAGEIERHEHGQVGNGMKKMGSKTQPSHNRRKSA